MYAVIETGGKQYRVSEGEIVRVERLASPVGDEVSISAVHFVVDGNDVQVGVLRALWLRRGVAAR